MEKLKPIHILLISVVLIIWGMAIWRMFSFSNTDDVIVKSQENSGVEQYTSKIPEERKSFIYKTPFRNPFLDDRSAKVEVVDKKDVKPIKRKPRFNYRVEGILFKEGNSVVILRDSQRKSTFLKKGDLFEKFTVYRIYPDSVVFATQDKQYITVNVKKR